VCVLNSDKSEKSYVPFAILSPNTNSTTAVLSILPYNFPKLLTLLDTLRTAQISNKPITSQLTQDLIQYFKLLPLYCQPSLHVVLSQYGLLQYLPTIPSYNKYLLRRLQKMKKNASDDLLQLENTFKSVILTVVLSS
jgi:hypothetical protein